MNQQTYDSVTAALMQSARDIEHAKRPGYVLGNEDVLANFRRAAERAGVSPGQAWAVLFLKHVDAILAIMTRPDLPMAEAPLGRFADAVNYLRLGFALLEDDATATRADR